VNTVDYVRTRMRPVRPLPPIPDLLTLERECAISLGRFGAAYRSETPVENAWTCALTIRRWLCDKGLDEALAALDAAISRMPPKPDSACERDEPPTDIQVLRETTALIGSLDEYAARVHRHDRQKALAHGQFPAVLIVRRVCPSIPGADLLVEKLDLTLRGSFGTHRRLLPR